MTELVEPENSTLSIKEEESETRLPPDTEFQEPENLVKYENRDTEPTDSNNDDDSLVSMSRTELIQLCKNSNSYISNLESKLANCEAEILSLKNAADYQKQRDPSYREKVLLRKLSLKEQEIQDYAAQINELKAAQIPSLVTLKSTLLDPAINIIVQKLKNELSCTKASLEETQNELNAWKFTPDSNTGKRLMAKCRLLHQENEELGKMISSGRVAKLEGELALQKSFSEEVKKSQFELDELLQDLDEDVEGMQGTIYYLQQELKKSKEKILDLEAKNQELRNVLDRNANQTSDSTDSKLPINIANTNDSRANFTAEDESSNDSCLILKVNPEEEYATMLSINDETIKTEENETDFKNKRLLDDSFKNVPPKKQKRLNVSQELMEKKDDEKE